jgi:hypothetical protein
MTIEIVLFQTWMQELPKGVSRATVLKTLYATGKLPEEAKDVRLVRFVSGKGGRKERLGVVPAEKVPHVSRSVILWLTKSSQEAGQYHFNTWIGWAGTRNEYTSFFQERGELGQCVTFGHGIATVLPLGLPRD